MPGLSPKNEIELQSVSVRKDTNAKAEKAPNAFLIAAAIGVIRDRKVF